MTNTNELPSLSVSELSAVNGGAAKWDQFVKSQRAEVASDYRKVVCTAAGVKGGPELATGVYGKERTDVSDMIRGAETVKSVCMGGARLPEAAPQSPF